MAVKKKSTKKSVNNTKVSIVEAHGCSGCGCSMFSMIILIALLWIFPTALWARIVITIIAAMTMFHDKSKMCCKMKK
ncbi:hypothetical protein COU61_02625 [Candidatus Pacearchaeota archaeon CG10_big_fil_rev_8_21_14_0_10_35_13]|nr:MAG: hypothetical protein COU61_02625 [Candidatus Pacearchaeota archaeon CG10_big_fil_rev_8_21_14_0_10_35_13]